MQNVHALKAYGNLLLLVTYVDLYILNHSSAAKNWLHFAFLVIILRICAKCLCSLNCKTPFLNVFGNFSLNGQMLMFLLFGHFIFIPLYRV